MIVIGDEILSGRTRDANMYHLAGQLAGRGIDLKEARIIGDNRAEIISAVRALCAAHAHVFTSGGIGPTHDDITADCVAAAFGVDIGVRDDARAAMAAHYAGGAADLTPARLRMARIPDGAVLIENTVSGAPGFSLQNLHVMAGVPHIFAAMLAHLLPSLGRGATVLSDSVRVPLPESTIAAPLGKIAKAYPALSIGSYPFYENGRFGANLVVRGTEADSVQAAVSEIKKVFSV